MKLEKTYIEGLYVIEPQVFRDERGWFMESHSNDQFSAAGVSIRFIQDNHSYSSEKYTLRGLHCQVDPCAQTKLVRCTRGSVWDVAIDLRRHSQTYLKWLGIELSEENQLQLLVPKGFAHGFVTLQDDTEVQYKVDTVYSRNHDRTIRYDDPSFDIDWKVQPTILSDKDRTAPYFKDSDIIFD
jgi:dTDP-4-dehydrorhamnose 3,5-epimerase